MNRARIARASLAFGLLLLAACARDEPTAPAPVPHTLSGNVRLTGYLIDASGQFAGTRIVTDADGVPVELVYGNSVVAQTTTVDGVYRFPGLASGGYLARVTIFGPLHDETTVVTVANMDVAASIPLELKSVGDILPIPNPYARPTDFYFDLPDTERVDVDLRDIAGNVVVPLFSDTLPRGLGLIQWDGLDAHRQPAPGPMYWVTLVAGQDVRAQLLFKQ